jgi:multidrug efflux pump
MTITLAAVYAPIGFQTGRTGRLFVEFALTLAGAVLVSGFVALTLSPMMCSLLLKHQTRHNFVYRFIERGLTALTNGYRRALRLALTVRPAIVLMGLLVAGGAYVIFTQLPRELAPTEDRGTILAIGVAPEGSTIDFTDRYAKRIEKALMDEPLVERTFLVIGFGNDVSRVISFARLVDWSKREVKQQEVTASLAPKLFGIPGLMAFASNPPSLGQNATEKPVQPCCRRLWSRCWRPRARIRASSMSTPTSSSTSPSLTSRSTARRRR